ncbi:MAG: 4Fe-4S dicluster domain-containing protein [Nitrososphaeria archaeon]
MSSDWVWVMRDYPKCTGCRMCEIACSLYHEKKIWPEASMVRVFMLAPGLEVPHLCAQCHDYPCVASCPTKPKKALSVDEKTGAVLVDRKICISCKNCIRACPGHVPFLHPADNKATICDLCNGEPQCSKICQEAQYNCLSTKYYTKGEGEHINHRLYSKLPKLITEGLSELIYGEKLEV